MKITEGQLRRIIRQEVQALSESAPIKESTEEFTEEDIIDILEKARAKGLEVPSVEDYLYDKSLVKVVDEYSIAVRYNDGRRARIDYAGNEVEILSSRRGPRRDPEPSGGDRSTMRQNQGGYGDFGGRYYR